MCHFSQVSRSCYYAWLKRKDKPDKDSSLRNLMSRSGTPIDNAPIENFFDVVKTECIYHQKINFF